MNENGKNAFSTEARESRVNVNREYKSDVFKLFFSVKKNALELYNAMNGSNYTNEDDLTINTLENSIFLKIYNDVSFVIAGVINLYEHQATINPNMPLIDLLYIADLFKPYVMQNDIYRSNLIKIPTPKFAVFYNGLSNVPDKGYLKLSDSFIQKTDDPELELKIQVLNINYGHNKELMEKCQSLRDYSLLNKRVRDNMNSGMNIEEAATAAVDSCIRDHVMEDFLIREKAGIIHMHVLDYDEELHEKFLKEDSKAETRAEIALKMLNLHMPHDTIEECTGLSEEEISQLSEQLKQPVQ